MWPVLVEYGFKTKPVVLGGVQRESAGSRTIILTECKLIGHNMSNSGVLLDSKCLQPLVFKSAGSFAIFRIIFRVSGKNVARGRGFDSRQMLFLSFQLRALKQVAVLFISFKLLSCAVSRKTSSYRIDLALKIHICDVISLVMHLNCDVIKAPSNAILI